MTGEPGLGKTTLVEEFFEQMAAAWVTIAETVDLLHRLHAKGHPLFCLSNMHAASIAYLEQTYAFWAVFTGAFLATVLKRRQCFKQDG